MTWLSKLIEKIKSNEPDKVVKDYKRKICLLIDLSVITDNNISIKECNKIRKYKDPEIETKRMWYFKSITVSELEETLGMIKND